MKMQSAAAILPSYFLVVPTSYISRLPFPTAATATPSSLLQSPLIITAVAAANPPPLPLPSKAPNLLLASVFSFSFCFKNNPEKPYFTVSSDFSYSNRPHVHCSSSNKVDESGAFLPPPPQDDDEDKDDDRDTDDDDDDIEIEIEIEKTGNNCRRIESEIGIEAPLSTVWNLLTGYERLADFIPGLAVCQLLRKTDNYARLFQIGQQNLAFGLKFNAKGIVDCYEAPLETLPNSGLKRDIQFKMVEGDFEIFQGRWSLHQQLNLKDQQMHTTLSYLVDVKPKLWLPVRLVEGRLCKEIKINLACIRQEALKITDNNTLHAR